MKMVIAINLVGLALLAAILAQPRPVAQAGTCATVWAHVVEAQRADPDDLQAEAYPVIGGGCEFRGTSISAVIMPYRGGWIAYTSR